jgi:hypothetical protein
MTITRITRRLFASAVTLSMAAGFVAAPVHFELDGTTVAMKSSQAFARRGRGKDDGANHDAGDDKGGQKAGKGRGRDDGANHDAGDDRGGKGRGRGTDDGPNHK